MQGRALNGLPISSTSLRWHSTAATTWPSGRRRPIISRHDRVLAAEQLGDIRLGPQSLWWVSDHLFLSFLSCSLLLQSTNRAILHSTTTHQSSCTVLSSLRQSPVLLTSKLVFMLPCLNTLYHVSTYHETTTLVPAPCRKSHVMLNTRLGS